MIACGNSRKASILAAALAGALFAGASFGEPGSAESRDEGSVGGQMEEQRELLPIPFAIREKLLRKMNRENLGALGEMLEALARDDLAEVARIANDLSYSAQTEKASKRRGSTTFAVMATDFHGQKMPAIRRAAEEGDRRQVLMRMSEAVTACMNCHAATRLFEWPEEKQYAIPAPVELPGGTPEPQRRIPGYRYVPPAVSPGP